MSDLQKKLRRAIMSPDLADIYDGHDERPGCSTQPFCGICKGMGRDSSMFCTKCDHYAFNRHWQGKPARELRALGIIGSDFRPAELRTVIREVDHALAHLRRGIWFAKELEIARKA